MNNIVYDIWPYAHILGIHTVAKNTYEAPAVMKLWEICACLTAHCLHDTTMDEIRKILVLLLNNEGLLPHQAYDLLTEAFTLLCQHEIIRASEGLQAAHDVIQATFPTIRIRSHLMVIKSAVSILANHTSIILPDACETTELFGELPNTSGIYLIDNELYVRCDDEQGDVIQIWQVPDTAGNLVERSFIREILGN
jgi:hypothetical protein